MDSLRSPLILAALTLLNFQKPSAASLKIPGETAYLDPDYGDARVSRRGGILDWSNDRTIIRWYGKVRKKGSAGVKIRLKSDHDGLVKLTLQVAGQESQRDFMAAKDTETVVSFGDFEISSTGHHPFILSRKSVDATAKVSIDVLGLEISGDLADEIHFNLKPRRNAASVHLAYPIPAQTQVAAFYCEMTALEDPVHSYYMACGWHRGYFGMQVNSSSERRIIFSVWDRGNEPTDPDKVQLDDRVHLLDKGDGVFTGRFGNEGTGGHSHLKYPWKTGSVQKFLVTAKPSDATHTTFSGFYFHPDSQEWMLISSWRAPGEGGYMRGLYSFSENFVGSNGHLLRKALYGSQWILDSEGNWKEVTTAKFSHDPTGRKDRLDRFMGLEKGQFFLSHGGFLDGFTEFGTLFQRPPTGSKPKELSYFDFQ